MPSFERFLGLVSAIILANGLVLGSEAARPAAPPAHPASPSIRSLSNLPLRFEANRGQTDPSVQFLSRGPGYTLFLTGEGAVLRLRSQKSEIRSQNLSPSSPQPRGEDSIIRMTLAGAGAAKATAFEPLPTKSNYLLGSDPAKWQSNVPNFGRVKYEGVYPGIDLIYYGQDSGSETGAKLEFDFVVAPGADPKRLRLVLKGGPTKLDANGDLVVATKGGEVRFRRPVTYQWVDGQRREIGARYIVRASKPELQTPNPGYEVAFELAAYDPRLPLIIDPVLSYSTLLGGGNADAGYGIATDSVGNIYVAGNTVSVDYPTKNPYQSVSNGNTDIFITKIEAAGAALSYSTYVGGAGSDSLAGMALDSSGSVIVAGTTNSPNFPTTTGVVQAALAAGTCGTEVCSDAFAAKLKADGSGLVFSTFLGGTGADTAEGMGIDSSGNAYLTGNTVSGDFPTASPLQASPAGGTDGYIAKLKADGTALVYSTFLGGTSGDFPAALAVDSNGNALVTGTTLSTDFPTLNAFQGAHHGAADGFVTGLNPAGDAWIFSTFLGGAADDHPAAMATDAAGNIYLGGETDSADFPVSAAPLQAALATGTCGTSPCPDGFLTKLDPTGATAVYSTYLGGTSADQVLGLAVNGAQEAFLTGVTSSADFPLQNPVQSTMGGGTCADGPCSDAFVTRLDAAGSLMVYSTFLGGDAADAGRAISVDANDNAFVTGSAGSSNFPATPGAFQTEPAGTTSADDTFAVKIGPGDTSALLLSASHLQFADQPKDFASDPLVLTLTNVGTASINIASVVVTGNFAQTNTCEPSLTGGSTACTFSVTFTPAATGDLTGDITITSDAPGSPHKVTLAGKGIEAKSKIVFDPAAVEFPDTAVGATSEPVAVTISNTGYSDVTITKIETIGNYAQTNNCPISPAVLARNASCTASLTFKPEGSGTRSGSLTITSNAGNAANGVNVLAFTADAITSFTLSSPEPSVIVERGTTTTTFTITAAGPADFTGELELACFEGLAPCSFSPAKIKLGESSTLTLSSLNTVNPESFTFIVRGTSDLQFAETSLTVTYADFTIERKPTFGTVAPGDSYVLKITLASTHGFDGSVSFACSSLPQESNCSFAPQTATLDGTNPATVDVKIQTTARVVSWAPPRLPSPPNPWLPVGAGLMAVLFVLGVRRRRARLLLFAMILLGMLLLSSCNDYYYYTYTGTLPGTFQVVITGTVGTVKHSTTFLLTVL